MKKIVFIALTAMIATNASASDWWQKHNADAGNKFAAFEKQKQKQQDTFDEYLKCIATFTTAPKSCSINN